MDFAKLEKLFLEYPMPKGYIPKYGTSGFREDAKLLDAVVVRATVMMVLRSKQVQQHCGIMVTASHNPENDNGLKLIDYTGDMIDETYESYALQLAMCNTFNDFQFLLQQIIKDCDIDVKKYCGYILVGQDTRTSGDHLVCICKKSILAIGGRYITVGKVTTPELHYNVASSNSNRKNVYRKLPYIHNLMSAFKKLYHSNHSLELHVDCANGVGAIKMIEIAKHLSQFNIEVSLYNTNNGKLNHMCGADFVEKSLDFPANMKDIKENAVCCSLDGDADRIVFFSKNKNKFVLLNGDKIACLIVKYLCCQFEDLEKKMNICVVHTPYANGAFISYIKDKFPLVHIQCAETGVKYLHRTAKQYDIGLYFESNGHGSVHFSKQCMNMKTIQIISNLLSQYTGDALGDLLFVLVALQETSFLEWMYMYQDFPCKQLKLYGDKSLFQTTDFGRKLTQPVGLQAKIDDIINNYSNSNCFVRPSGTEDLLRMYVECKNETLIDNLVVDTIHVISTYTDIQVK
jgi:phosphoacetylglucosamine mutase